MKIKERFRHNLGMKLLAVVSAFVLWLYVAYQNPATEQVLPQVPLEYQGLPKDVAVVGIPKTVIVRIQGVRALEGDLASKDVRAYVDLKEARVGNNILNVNVTMPAGSRLVSISPERVSVQLDVIKEKQVPVQVEFVGAPKVGYTRLSPVLKPDQVLVRGPQEFLERVKQAYLVADLTGWDKNYSHTIPPRLMDADGNTITEKSLQVTPAGVEVFIPVVKKLPTRIVEVRPKIVGKTAAGYRVARVIYDPDVVTISGTEDILNRTGYLETENIDIEGAKKDVVKEARLLGPKGISWSGKSKIKVVVQVEALPIPINNQEVEVELRNLPKGKTAVVLPTKVKVFWSQKVEKAQGEGVTAWVDLEGLPAGSHDLPVQVSLPQGAKLERVEPVTVQVEILDEPQEQMR